MSAHLVPEVSQRVLIAADSLGVFDLAVDHDRLKVVVNYIRETLGSCIEKILIETNPVLLAPFATRNEKAIRVTVIKDHRYRPGFCVDIAAFREITQNNTAIILDHGKHITFSYTEENPMDDPIVPKKTLLELNQEAVDYAVQFANKKIEQVIASPEPNAQAGPMLEKIIIPGAGSEETIIAVVAEDQLAINDKPKEKSGSSNNKKDEEVYPRGKMVDLLLDKNGIPRLTLSMENVHAIGRVIFDEADREIVIDGQISIRILTGEDWGKSCKSINANIRRWKSKKLG